MYICICNQITESQLRVDIERGNDTVRQLRESLGVTQQCGKCGKCVKNCIKEHNSSATETDLLIPATCSA